MGQKEDYWVSHLLGKYGTRARHQGLVLQRNTVELEPGRWPSGHALMTPCHCSSTSGIFVACCNCHVPLVDRRLLFKVWRSRTSAASVTETMHEF
jgi:hypothetical protein